MEVLLINALAALLVTVIIRKNTEIFKGVPIYLMLFVPGLGGVLVLILYFSLAYFMRDSIVLSDYELLIEFHNKLNFKEKINYDKEVRSMSFLDMLDALGSKEKKQLIIDSEIYDYQGKIKLLQKGLSEKDKEIQHYSATLLNDKENQYTNKINYLREEYNIRENKSVLEKLAKAYKQYITSGLIEGEVLYIFNLEFIETLKNWLNIDENNFYILDDLVKAYIRNKDFDNAEKTNFRLLKEYPNNEKALLNRMNISFEKDSLSDFDKLISSLTEEQIKSSKKIEGLVSFWIEKEG
jgi:hypothetical protein